MTRRTRHIHNPNLTERLQTLAQDIRAKQQHLKFRETQRDMLIAAALEEGWTFAQIADAAGISRSRVGQIAAKTPDSEEES